MSEQATSSAEPSTYRRRYAPIYLRELKSYFTNPIGYVVLVVFLVPTAILFFSTLFLAGVAEMRRFFELLPISLGVFLPAISMGTIAEERRRGTFETLVTMPVRLSDIVLVKFAGVLTFTVIMLAPTVLYAVSLASIGNLDVGPIIGGYLGAILLAGFYAAIGVFASSLTENQIVAVIVGVLICLFLALIQQFLILIPSEIADPFLYISSGYHFDRFAQGVLDTRSILYFLSGMALFLLVGWRVLVRERGASA
jgi:ABC-2 type transport system permease protein